MQAERGDRGNARSAVQPFLRPEQEGRIKRRLHSFASILLSRGVLYAAADTIAFGPGPVETEVRATYTGGIVLTGMTAGGTQIFDGGTVLGGITLDPGAYDGSTVIFKQMLITPTAATHVMFSSSAALANATVIFDRCTITLVKSAAALSSYVFDLGTLSADALRFEVTGTSITGAFNDKHGAIVRVQSSHNNANVTFRNSVISYKHGRGFANHFELISMEGGTNVGSVFTLEDTHVTAACADGVNYDCQTYGIHTAAPSIGGCTITLTNFSFTTPIYMRVLSLIDRDTTKRFNVNILNMTVYANGWYPAPFLVHQGYGGVHLTMERSSILAYATMGDPAIIDLVGTPTGRGSFRFTDVDVTYLGSRQKRFMRMTTASKGLNITMTRCRVNVTNSVISRAFRIAGASSDVSIVITDSVFRIQGTATAALMSILYADAIAERLQLSIANTSMTVIGTHLSVATLTHCPDCLVDIRSSAVVFQDSTVVNTMVDVLGNNIKKSRFLLRGNSFLFQRAGTLLIRQPFAAASLGVPSEIDVGCPDATSSPGLSSSVNGAYVSVEDHVVPRLQPYTTKCRRATQEHLPARTVRQHWLKTVAGNGGQGSTVGSVTLSQVDTPSGIAYDSSRDVIYFAQYATATIVKLNVVKWTTELYAGSGTSTATITNGPVAGATFGRPTHMVFDTHHERLIISDERTHHVRGIDVSVGTVYTIAGSGSAGSADGVVGTGHLDTPAGVALSMDNATVLIACRGNNAVRVAPADGSGALLTKYGSTSGEGGFDNGAAASARMTAPGGIVTARRLSMAFVTNAGSCVRFINLLSDFVGHLAGDCERSGAVDGVFADVRFDGASGLAMGHGDDALYVSDTHINAIRRLDLLDNTAKIVAGDFKSAGNVDGAMGTSRLNAPSCLTSDYRTGVVFACSIHKIVALSSRHYVRVFAGTPMQASATDGAAGTGSFPEISGMDVHLESGFIFVGVKVTRQIAQVSKTGNIAYVAGSGAAVNVDADGLTAQFARVDDVLVHNAMSLLYIGSHMALRTMTATAPFTVATVGGHLTDAGAADGVFGTHRVGDFHKLSHGPQLNIVYFTDRQNHAVRTFETIGAKRVETIGGQLQIQGTLDGAAASSQFDTPISIGYRRLTNVMYIGGRTSVRTIDMTTKIVATVLSDFHDEVAHIRFTPDDDTILISDADGGCLRVIDANTLTARDPIGPPGYIGWGAGGPSPAAPRETLTQAELSSLLDGPSDVARIVTAGAMSKTQPPWSDGLLIADAKAGVLLQLTGEGIDALNAGKYIIDHRPAKSEQWYYNRVAGETAGACVHTGTATSHVNPFVARIKIPFAMAVDRPGGAVYTADFYQHTIRRLDLRTLALGRIAGGVNSVGVVDGPASSARFDRPRSFVMDDVRRLLFIAEVGSMALRALKVDDLTSPTAVALFSGTRSVAGSTDGLPGTGQHSEINNFCHDGFRTRAKYFWTTEASCLIRRVDGDGEISTKSGAAGECLVQDGVAGARFRHPIGIAVSPGRNTAFITERSHCLRRMSLSTFAVTSIFCTAGAAAGKFPGTHLWDPSGLVVSRDEGSLYVAEWAGSTIRRIDLDTFDSELIAGTFGKRATGMDDGVPGQSRLNEVWSMDLDPKTGSLWVADAWSCSIGVLTNGTTTAHVSGHQNILNPASLHREGSSTAARYSNLVAVSYDPRENTAYLGTYNRVCNILDLKTGQMNYFAGNGGGAGGSSAPMPGPRLTSNFGSCYNTYVDVPERQVYISMRGAASGPYTIYRSPIPATDTLELMAGSGSRGYVVGLPGVSRWDLPSGVATVEGDDLVYACDRLNHGVRTIHKRTKMSSARVVGCGIGVSRDGTLLGGCLLQPHTITYSFKRRGFFVGEVSGQTIRFFSFEENVLRTIAGVAAGNDVEGGIREGRFLEAEFDLVTGFVLAPSEDEVLFGSYSEQVGRLDLTSGCVSEFIGTHGYRRPLYNGATFLMRLRSFGVSAGEPGELLVTDANAVKKATHFVSHHWASVGDSKFTVTSLLGPKHGDDAVRGAVTGVAVVPAHDAVYVTLPHRGVVVEVKMSTHESTVVLGHSQFSVAVTDDEIRHGPTPADVTLSKPAAIAHDPATDILYIAEYAAGRIRSAAIPFSTTATLTSSVTAPAGIAIGQLLNSSSSQPIVLFVTDDRNHVVSSVDISSGVVSHVAGIFGTAGYSNGAAASALFDKPTGVAFHNATKSIYIADKGNHLVRRVQLTTNTVSTVAGLPHTRGHIDGGFSYARFDEPFGITVKCSTDEQTGLTLFVTDAGGRGVRALDFSTSTVKTVAGRLGFRLAVVDGNGTAARFGLPQGIAAHPCRCDVLYAADAAFGRVVEIAEHGLDAFIGNASLAGSPPTGRRGNDAVIADPRGLSYDRDGGRVIVASSGFNVVYSVNISTRVLTVIAGKLQTSGVADGALGTNRLQTPGYVLYVHTKNAVFISDQGARTVRYLTLTDLHLATLAGAPGAATPTDGNGAAARFNYPTGLVLSARDHCILVGDFNAGAIRRVRIDTNDVITVAGQLNDPGHVDGVTATSKLMTPLGMARHRGTRRVYIACDDATVRVLDERSDNALTTLVGAAGSHADANGNSATARLNHPSAIALAGDDGDGETLLYIGTQRSVRRVHLARNNTVDTLIGSNTGASHIRRGAFSKTGTIHGLAVDKHEVLYIAHDAGEVSSVIPQLPRTVESLVAANVALENQPNTGDAVGATFGPFDKRAEYAVSVVVGDPGTSTSIVPGNRATARVAALTGGAIHVKHNALYIGSATQHCIVKVDLVQRSVAVFSGTPGTPGTTDGASVTATWTTVQNIVFRPSEADDPTTMYVASHGPHSVRTVDMTAPHTVTTIAGTATAATVDGLGTLAQLDHPVGLAFDGTESFLYIVTRGGHNVRRMRMSDQMVTLIAGPRTPEATHLDGVGESARFNDPIGIAFRISTAMFYVACRGALRKLDPSTPTHHSVTTVAGFGDVGTSSFGPLDASTVDYLHSLAFDPADDRFLFTTEYHSDALSRFDLDKGTRSLIAGVPGASAGAAYDGPANRTQTRRPWGIPVHPVTGEMYFSANTNGYIGKVFRTIGGVDENGGAANGRLALRTVIGSGVQGTAPGVSEALRYKFALPASVTYDTKRGALYVVDTENCRIVEYRRESKQVQILLGHATLACPGAAVVDGSPAVAVLKSPAKAVYVARDDTLFWVETLRVARMPFATMVTETLAGKWAVGFVDGGVGTSRCTRTVALAVSVDGNVAFVADLDKHALRSVDLTAPLTPITTLVGVIEGHVDGPQATAQIASPHSLALRRTTGILYIGTGHGTVRYYDPVRKTVSTFAGVHGDNSEVVPGSIAHGGPARFRAAFDLVFSHDTETLFLTSHQLVRIDMNTMSLSSDVGHSTEVRCQDGVGVAAGFNSAHGIALVDTSIYIAATQCFSVMAIDAVDFGAHDAAALQTTVATVAGNISGRLASIDSQASTETMLTDAHGIAVDQARRVAYISGATSLRLLSFDRFSMSTLIGADVEPPDSASSACSVSPRAPELKRPAGLLLDSTKTQLFIAEQEGHRVLQCNVSYHIDVTFTVFAGSGIAGSVDHAVGVTAQLNGPVALAWGLESAAPTVYVADEHSHAVRSIHGDSPNAVLTIAGTLGRRGHKDGNGTSAQFDRPAGIAVLRLRRGVDAAFVACRGSHTIRRIDLATNVVSTIIGRPYIAGIGSGTDIASVFYAPGSVTADAAGTGLYVSDRGSRSVKHVFVDDSDGPVESATFAGYPSSLSDEVAPARDGSREDALFTSRVGQVALLSGAMAGQTGDVAMLAADRGTIRIAFNATAAVTTVAGVRGYKSSRIGNQFSTTFNKPVGIAHAPQQDHLFVSTEDAHMVVMVDLRTSVSSFIAGHPTEAGIVHGAGTAARFTQLAQLLFDAATAVLYVCDAGAHNIRAIATGSNTVSNFAGSDSGTPGTTDGVGAGASFRAPVCLQMDGTREHMLICDRDNDVIRRVRISTRAVSLLSGAFGVTSVADGTPTNARYSKPVSIARRTKTGSFYIACREGHVIREMDPSSFSVTRIGTAVAGTVDAAGTAAQFAAPSALALSPDQRYLYVLSSSSVEGASGSADSDGALRQIDLDDAFTVRTVAGQNDATSPIDGPLGAAQFGSSQMVLDPTGGFFLASTLDHTVKRLSGLHGFGSSEANTSVITVAGQLGIPGTSDAVRHKALLKTPSGLSISETQNAVYFAETSSCLVRQLSLDSYNVSIVAGSFSAGVSTCGHTDGLLLTAAQFDRPNDVLVDDSTDTIFVGELSAAIRRIDLATGATDLFAGTHTPGLSEGIGGQMGEPSGMQLSQDGAFLYFCDKTNNRIRRVTVATKSLATVAGSVAGFADGVGPAARMDEPRQIARRPGTDIHYVADSKTNSIRAFDPATNAVSTLIGWGYGAGVAAGTLDAKPGVWLPTGIAFADSDTMYVTSADTDAMWRMDLSGDETITAIGNGPRRRRHSGARDDGDASKAAFHHPSAVTIDRRTGEVYVADQQSHAIRRVFRTDSPRGYIETIVGNASAVVLSARDGSVDSSAQLDRPSRGVALRDSILSGRAEDTSESSILIVENEAGLIRRVWPRSGKIQAFIGKKATVAAAPAIGAGPEVGLNSPAGIVVNEDERVMFIASRGGHRVLRYDFATAMVSLLFGDGTANHQDGNVSTPVQVNEPDGVALSADKTELFVTSRGSHVIRRTLLSIATPTTSTPYGTVDTAGTTAGSANAGRFHTPSDIQLHKRTNTLYVISSGASIISTIDITTGYIAPILGTAGSTRAVDGPAVIATLHNPSYAAFGVREGIDDDYLYIADEGSHLIRVFNVHDASRATLHTIVGDVDRTFAVGAYVDGLPRQSRCDQPGQPIPMSDGSVAFADTAANVVRSLRFSQLRSSLMQHPPSGQLLADGAATPGREDGSQWTFPTSKPWRVVGPSVRREFQTDESGEALGRASVNTEAYTMAVSSARYNGSTAYHAVLTLSFRAAAYLKPPLLPTVNVTLACFPSQTAADVGAHLQTKAAASFSTWVGYRNARRQRSAAVRYPLSADCGVVTADVHLIGFTVITNIQLHFAPGVVPDDVFQRLVAAEPWVDPSSVTPVESLTAAVPAPVKIGNDTALPSGGENSSFVVIPPLAPGFAEGSNVFQCNGSFFGASGSVAEIVKTVILNDDQRTAITNGSLRVAVGALVASVGTATSFSITASPSNLTLLTHIPSFNETLDGHLSWIGVPDVALPPNTTSVVVRFETQAAADGACSVFDAFLFGFRSELSDQLDDVANIDAVSSPPTTSLIPDGDAEGPTVDESNTMWPDDSMWMIADPGVGAGGTSGDGERQRPLWLRGGRFAGAEGRRSFVVPAQPMAITGREHSRDFTDTTTTFGGTSAAGNVTIDVSAYAEAIDQSRMDVQLSFIYAAPASSVSTMFPADLDPVDRAIVEEMKLNVSLTATGLGWVGSATVLPQAMLRPSAGAYGRIFRVTGRLPKLARSVTLTLVLCPGCAIDNVELFLKERAVASSTFALAPVAEVEDSAALNTDFDGAGTTSWSVVTGSVASVSTTNATLFPIPGAGDPYPSARSIAVDYVVGPSLFSVCSAGASMTQDVSLPPAAIASIDARRGFVQLSFRLISAAASVPFSVRVEAKGCANAPAGPGLQCGGHIAAAGTFFSDESTSEGPATRGSAPLVGAGGTLSPAVVELVTSTAFLPKTTTSIKIVVDVPPTSSSGNVCVLFDDLKVSLVSGDVGRTVTPTVRGRRLTLARMQVLFFATLTARFIEPNPGGDFRSRYEADEAYRAEVRAAVLQEISTVLNIDPDMLWVGPMWPLFPA